MPESALPAQIDPESVVTSDGESVPISLIDLDVLASWIDQLRDMKKAEDAAIRAISAEIVRRADQSAQTQVEGTQRWVRVTGAAPTPRWDPPQLSLILGRLVHQGVLTEDAIRGVVRSERVWKVDTTAMKRLCKIAAVKAAADTVALPPEEPERRVTSTGWLS